MLTESEIKGSLGEYGETEFTIQSTRFKIYKLSPSEAFSTLEKIRVASAPVLASTETGGNFAAVVAELLKVDSEQLVRIRDDLFKGVRFINDIAKTETTLRGNVDMAFNGLLPIHIYEVLARALIVNFLESFLDILRRGAGEA